jgi:flavin reductase (DIM6/NTAB) family NADH-FMN oxidoreductase RutF
MGKQKWKPGNMIYPLPAVLVTCRDKDGNDNVFTVAWTGTVCTNPPMTYISVRPSRHSYNMIKESGEFVLNLTTEDLAFATDYCGVKSGKDIDKFKELNLEIFESKNVKCPSLELSPVNMECKVKQIIPLGSHDMFLAEVVGVSVNKDYLDSNNRFDLNKANLITYSHGEYFDLGNYLGKFGYSVKKN